MAGVKQEPDNFGSEQVEVSVGEISQKSGIQNEGTVKLGSLSCLKLEQSEYAVCEKGSDGVIVEVEEEMGKVSISGALCDFSTSLVCESETENERVVGKDDNGLQTSEAAGMDNCSTVSGRVAKVISKSEESDEVAIISRAEEISINGSMVNGDKLKGDEDGSSRDTESESERSSSSSASSSDDEDEEENESSSSEEEEDEEEEEEEKEEEAEVDMEEGEIEVSEPEDDEDTGAKGPIRSRNEFQDLPPVPAVTATLEPHHGMLPVGAVSSIIGAQVVVEGVEKHNPLDDGSILWITESRSPLGIVDEIFGPVKNPYYIVRYNSEDEVPPEIQQGSLISFVPEFAKHVLNDKSLYKKGYDASDDNVEEVSAEEEFSDDEKEAEYRRMQKMKKRGATNDQNTGYKRNDKRKLKSRSQNWRNGQGTTASENARPPVDLSKRFIPAAAGQGIQASASFQGHRQSSVPPLFPHTQNGPSSGVWSNGIPYQQAQNMGFPTSGGLAWPQQQQMLSMPLSNAVPFEQQISPALPQGFVFPGPALAPWPALGQNVFSRPPLTMVVQGQLAPAPMFLGGQGSWNGLQAGQNNNSQPHAATLNFNQGSPNFNQGTQNFNQGTQNVNQGTPSGGGRRGNYRGGGRFGGRRGQI